MTDPLRILIVEDEGLIGLMLEEMVASLGHLVAANCFRLRDGVEKAQTLDFELAIVDIKLSDGTSAPILDILDRRNIPSIISSGYGDLGEVEIGNRPRLAKPYLAAELAKAIDQAILS